MGGHDRFARPDYRLKPALRRRSADCPGYPQERSRACPCTCVDKIYVCIYIRRKADAAESVELPGLGKGTPMANVIISSWSGRHERRDSPRPVRAHSRIRMG